LSYKWPKSMRPNKSSERFFYVMEKAPAFSLFRDDNFDKECEGSRNFIKHCQEEIGKQSGECRERWEG
jgi:hypothetical protein